MKIKLAPTVWVLVLVYYILPECKIIFFVGKVD